MTKKSKAGQRAHDKARTVTAGCLKSRGNQELSRLSVFPQDNEAPQANAASLTFPHQNPGPPFNFFSMLSNGVLPHLISTRLPLSHRASARRNLRGDLGKLVHVAVNIGLQCP